MQILILGMHRSGTSATARLVNMMGAYFGPEGISLGYNQDNNKGFWERKDVMALNDTLLRSQGCEWDRLAEWRFGKVRGALPQFDAEMYRLLLDLDAHRPWFIKDPRLCLTLPAWRALLEAPVAVIVYRDPLEVAVSLRTRDKMPLHYGMALWEYYAIGLLNASRGMPRVFVKHHELMQKPFKTCEKLYADLVAQDVRRLALPSTREVRAFIDPDLYRAKPPQNGIELTPHQQALADMLQGSTPQEDIARLSDEARTLIRIGLPVIENKA